MTFESAIYYTIVCSRRAHLRMALDVARCCGKGDLERSRRILGESIWEWGLGEGLEEGLEERIGEGLGEGERPDPRSPWSSARTVSI